jgi:cyclic pyranopterin monophosphate synthase
VTLASAPPTSITSPACPGCRGGIEPRRRVACTAVEDPDQDEGRLSAGTSGLTHIDSAGRARMVDVSGKPWTRRRAVARCRVLLGDATDAFCATEGANSATGAGRGLAEVLDAARLAGIQAAKQTPRLIPLCHPLSSSEVRVRTSVADGTIEVESHAEVIGPTGVEMEALTACAIAGLSLLAAVLPRHPEARIDELTLWEKSGGRSGTWVRTPVESDAPTPPESAFWALR